MVTLSKRRDVPAFGRIEGNSHLPFGAPGACRIELSPLGRIVRNCIFDISLLEPSMKLLQYAMMPDHVHVLVFVQQPVAKPLGHTIARLKIKINAQNGGNAVFEEGFNARFPHPGRSLEVLYRYLRDNPRRLAVRREHPDFFRRISGIAVAGHVCRAYGNLQLLDNPFKEQVVVHRADSASELERKRTQWLHAAANGGVLVSPFISPAEKAVRREAEVAGARIILITNEPMHERFKPTGADFDRCEQGRLLIVSMPGGDAKTVTREECLAMNSIAAHIAAG